MADIKKKLGPAKHWKKNAVVNQRFIITLDQQRGPKPDEDLNIGATHAIVVTVDKLAEENMPEDYEMTLQIGSREHIKDGHKGEPWKVPVGDFTKQARFTQQMLKNVSRVLNSGEFISSDIDFSASVLFMKPETKEGKRSGCSPGEKMWKELAKELRCVRDIKNKDELCCARAIVVMREYAKREKGASNSFENIRKDRGKNSQQVKEARKLHREANVPEGPCGAEELDKFQGYLGLQGYKLIVVDAQRGGIIYTGEKFKEMPKNHSFSQVQLCG